MSAENEQGTCFVVMGFGKKTDFETGRTLDLDKTYRNIIKPAVQAAGLKCVRADEIVHSGLIDVPMYDQLLNADVVVADLSTSNKNAFYELGVRHALKPYTTIIICEDGIRSFPFDVNHVAVRQYHHLGDGIDYDEVERFRKLLSDAVTEIYNKSPRPNDSPVYTFLPGLTPPALAEAMHGVAEEVAKAASAIEAAAQVDGVVYTELMKQVDEAQAQSDFATAKILLSQLRKMKRAAAAEWSKTATVTDVPAQQEDPYLIQRLALVTYKSEQPSPQAALEEARGLLLTLDPATSNDTETLGLWGAVHKRLWNVTKDRKHLEEAVRGYERGFYLRNDYYNGINLAFLLNVRAANAASRAEAIADFVQAERVRHEVIDICLRWLESEAPPVNEGLKKKLGEKHKSEAKYWVMASLAEAYVGIGDDAEAQRWFTKAGEGVPEQWMKETTEEQISKLRAHLADSPLKYLKTSGE